MMVSWFHRSLCFCCLFVTLFLSVSALADGMAVISWDASATNHPALMLSDGRVLVAGGTAISAAVPEHEIGAGSEMWDPRSGEWHTLNNGLTFELDQRVYLNQMTDGRVLFFAVRKEGKAEYQARIWDPKSDSVEKLLVDTQPQLGVDVIVLVDGRVLIANAGEGGIDIWNSNDNNLGHFDEPLPKDREWRVLSMSGTQVLLVETFLGDGEKIGASKVLLLNLADGSRHELAQLPVALRSESSLSLMADGSIQANVEGLVYKLPVLDGRWETEVSEKSSRQVAEVGGGAPLAKPLSNEPETARVTTVKSSWVQSYMEKVGTDLKWMFIFVPFAMMIFLALGINNDHLPYMIRASLRSMLKWLGVVSLVMVVWILLRDGPVLEAQANVLAWWDEHRDVIAVLVFCAAIIGPTFAYFLLRRMEAEKQKRVLARVSKVVQALMFLYMVYLVSGPAAEEYRLFEQGKTVGGSVWLQVVVALDHEKWMILAVLIPVGLYFLLRRLEEDKQERFTAYANTAFRVAVLGSFASFFLMGTYVRGENDLRRLAAECGAGGLATVHGEQLWAQCIDGNSGMISRFLFNKTKERVMSLPAVPCDFVGVWISSRQNSKYHITLTDDSRFVAKPIFDGQGSRTITGTWGARDGEMIWFEDGQFHWPIDVNPVLPEGKGHFRLVEVNGEVTEFNRIKELDSRACSI